MTEMLDRRAFLHRAAVFTGGLASMGAFQSLAAREAYGSHRPTTTGYGPLAPKGELALPVEFNYDVVQRQFEVQRDGTLVPGLMDGMGAFPNPGEPHTTILIRNHENRRQAGEVPVVVAPEFRYDEDVSYNAGDSKVVVRRNKVGMDPAANQPIYSYDVVDSFNILGGTDTNCAGGVLPFKKWIACEEVVNRGASGKKHGYNFEIDALSDGPVKAVPILAAGRFHHEATAWRAGILYETEDERIVPDVPPPIADRKPLLGSCFYRYIPDDRVGQSGNLAETTGILQALKLKSEFHANMDTGRAVGVPYDVEWVTVDEPDHDDDTNRRRDRVPGFTPTRVQAQDKGAAFFDRQEGMWTGVGDSKIYFDCTEGGAMNLGQVWEHDPGRETITLIYESSSALSLENPDNIVIVPQTGDVLLCEDSPGTQFIRGVTQEGEIYDFAELLAGTSELAGACFDPDQQTLYVNRFGRRGAQDRLPPQALATTYAIYGPFEQRLGDNSKTLGSGPSV
ncbi:MAG: PhoX family protein [Actinomycetota bacterium]|nr:PhoX family protein [Actinomycetota bacterium]